MHQPATATQQDAAPRIRKMRYVRFANGTACYSTAGRRPAGYRRAVVDLLAGGVLLLVIVLQFIPLH
ncbi:hypothetical protein [Chromobacterium sphagni]|uniref:Uncharacterized protein n=1 Tax=Chromobacterium sphagni TaxID=1903179 RepID=A0ABX3CEE6_9NEIS|nr:hypothetical protein [Chromobacterium sphagni]OHX20415.1 hypothetical protein BI344_08050 [Chromobacterium sphagni]OHX20901.1 hypothetical protein BI344_22420 [Chromobacterium sphagni]